MADKCGEVVSLRVDRAIGIQGRPPPVHLIPKCTSWRFGSLEKSKDCIDGVLSMLGVASASIFWALESGRGGIYWRSRPCMTASRGSCDTLPRAS